MKSRRYMLGWLALIALAGCNPQPAATPAKGPENVTAPPSTDHLEQDTVLTESTLDEDDEPTVDQPNSVGAPPNGIALDAWGPLIDTTSLQAHLKHDQVVILDLGPKRSSYDAGHIPGARFVHWIDDITDETSRARYNNPSAAWMGALLGRLGIQAESHIVLYDNLSSRVSTRMYWSLKTFGIDNLHVLNGGIAAWKSAGHEMETNAPADIENPQEQKLPEADPQLAATLTQIAEAMAAGETAFLDGRPPSQYSGAEPGKVYHTKQAHKKRGHIPGAINVFWKDNFDADQQFKDTATLAKLYADQNLAKDKPIVTYCNEGLHAATSWFVLSELLGYTNVRVYDDSMAEWANSEQPTELSPGIELPTSDPESTDDATDGSQCN